MPSRASCSRGASSAVFSSAASRKSVNRPNSRLPSRLARKRTSRASIRLSILRGLVSRVGTTTSVRNVAGMPAEKSMRGSGWGDASRVASQLTRATANWPVASRARMAVGRSNQAATPSNQAAANRPAARPTVRSVMAPRYSARGDRAAPRLSLAANGNLAWAVFSSSLLPWSIR